MSLAVSTARVDITPPPDYLLMGGYGTATGARLATGTYSPLHARAVVIWDDGVPRVIVSADVLGIPASIATQIRAALPNLPATNLMLLASHTHNGPVLPDALDPYIAYGITSLVEVDAYAQTWVGQIVALIQNALASPQTPATLDYQVTSQAWSRNRAGLSYHESAVPVLVARGTDGMPVAVLYSYGCHPVSAGIRTQWDGDYPSVASAAIEAAIPGSVALYVPGPAGDQDPAGSRGMPLRCRLGAQLGASVVTAATSVGRILAGPIQTSRTVAQLPLDVTTTPSNLAAVRTLYAARAANTSLQGWYRRHGQIMVERIDAGTIATTVPAPIQVWRFAGSPALKWAVVGGELVSGYGVYFRQRHGGVAGLMIGGYGDGCGCYIPSNELLPPHRTSDSYEGGYMVAQPGLASGSQTVYGHIGRFRAGSVGGVESTLIATLGAALA